ncbi:MAG TPA: hypothetical protein PKC72_00205 [Chitinophagaceae bacterium]|mgnify:CR=1 FL=1|nr:hypothetical protein [Chitinophagaceae bacterium]
MLKVLFFILSILLFAESTNVSLLFKDDIEAYPESVAKNDPDKDSESRANTSEKQMDKHFMDSFLNLEAGFSLIAITYHIKQPGICTGYYFIPFMPPEFIIA